MTAKRKRAHAGFTREEWRALHGLGKGQKAPPIDPPPREDRLIWADLAFQLETMWTRFPREFVK